MDNVVAGVRAREVARAVPELPLRLAIADRSVAIFPLVPGGLRGSLGEPTTALVRDSNLLGALQALLERYWQDGGATERRRHRRHGVPTRPAGPPTASCCRCW